MYSAITIKDIARKFKCSNSTVSRALNDYPLINIETRRTIQEYAQKMGYQKNSISLNLLNQSSNMIGIVVPDILHAHENIMLEGVQSVLNPMGYSLNFCVSNENKTKEIEHLFRLKSNRVAGILISPSQESYQLDNDEHIRLLRLNKIPVVFMDREANGEDYKSVTVDNYLGAYMATQHLIDIGCNRIAHLGGPIGVKVSNDRLKGYTDCLLKNNLPIDEEIIISIDFNIESALEPTKKLFELKEVPDGIFGVNDEVCFGALQVLRNKHIYVPDQVAVIGFDNCNYASFSNPSLSSINRNSFEIGVLAANMLISEINNTGQKQNSQHTVLKPQLIKRESTSRSSNKSLF